MISTFQNLAFFFHKFKLEIYFCRHYGSSQFYLTDIMEMRNFIFIFILSDIALAPQKKSVNQRKKKEWPNQVWQKMQKYNNLEELSTQECKRSRNSWHRIWGAKFIDSKQELTQGPLANKNEFIFRKAKIEKEHQAKLAVEY